MRLSLSRRPASVLFFFSLPLCCSFFLPFAYLPVGCLSPSLCQPLSLSLSLARVRLIFFLGFLQLPPSRKTVRAEHFLNCCGALAGIIFPSLHARVSLESNKSGFATDTLNACVRV